MKKYILFALILFSNSFIGQTNGIVAEVGEYKIENNSFQERLNFMPFSKSGLPADSVKEHILFTMIAEKLWADEATRLALNRSDYYIRYSAHLQGMFARDLLFKEEVLDNINITDAEIAVYSRRITTTCLVNYIICSDKNEADIIYTQLKNGDNFFEILKLRPEYSNQIDPVEVKYGQMDPQNEDIIFSLKKGEFSVPVFRDSAGWVIYHLTGTMPNINKEINPAREAQKMLDTRYREMYNNKFYETYLSRAVVKSDSVLVRKFIDLVYSSLNKFAKIKPNDSREYYSVTEQNVRELLAGLNQNERNKSIIMFSDTPLTFEDFVWSISFDEIKIYNETYKSVVESIVKGVRDFTRKELIRRIARQKGYHLRPEVKAELEKWQTSILASMARNNENGMVKVSEQEVLSYAEEKRENGELKADIIVEEIFSYNLDVISKCFELLDNNQEFTDLAKKYSERNSNVSHLINSLGPDNYPEYWQAVFNLQVGEIFGPLKIDGGYAIVKVVKKEYSSSEAGNNKKLLEGIKSELFFKKLEASINEKTVSMAKNTSIKINSELVKKIRYIDVPIMVYRHIGFGGKINAVPVTPVFSDWYNIYRHNTNKSL